MGNVEFSDSEIQDFADPQTKTGFVLSGEKMVGPVILGAGLVQRGWEYNLDFGEIKYEQSFSFTYLDLYALYPYAVNNQISIFAGLEAGYFLSGNIESTGSDDEKIEGDDLALDYGLTLGGDYFFMDNVGVRAAYYLGMSDLGKNDLDEFDARHNGIKISLLYKL